MFTYIFKGISHSDTSIAYMTKLGMTNEQIDSVVAQKEWEESQDASAK